MNQSNRHEVPIAIVGGGAAGVWQAAAFSTFGASEMAIVEPADRLGRGLAYSTSNNDHLLNVTANKLDAHPLSEFEGFVPWLERHGFSAEENYFPRKIYGEYMEDVVAAIRSRSILQHHATTAKSVRAVSDGFALLLANGDEICARRVVLALGNLKPRRLAATDLPGLVEDPWNIPPAAMVAANDVVIAGTGLTAIDAVVSIAGISPSARFTLVANRPFMPPSDGRSVQWPGIQSLALSRPSGLWHSVIAEIRHNRELGWISVMEGLKTRSEEFCNVTIAYGDGKGSH